MQGIFVQASTCRQTRRADAGGRDDRELITLVFSSIPETTLLCCCGVGVGVLLGVGVFEGTGVFDGAGGVVGRGVADARGGHPGDPGLHVGVLGHPGDPGEQVGVAGGHVG